MFKQFYNKLNNKKGETLAEVLVAVLIIALALALMASMIMVSSNLVSNGQKTVEKFYKGINAVEAHTSADTEAIAGGSHSLTITPDTAIIYYEYDSNYTEDDGFAHRRKKSVTNFKINIDAYKAKNADLKAYDRIESDLP